MTEPTARERWVLIGKANAVFERAAQAKYPKHMFVPEAVEAIMTGTKSYSLAGDIMRESKYGSYARENGYPLIALPIGTTEATPTPKKPDFWKPPL